MEKRVFTAMLSAMVLALGCASFQNNTFLVQQVDDSNKSIALTNQGIRAYDSWLVERAAYDRVEAVRRYFVVALSFDPGNQRARQYLGRVDDFKSGLLRDRLQVVDRLMAKSERREEENYALVVALRTVTAVDPSNDSAARLLRESAALQASLAESLLARSREAQARAADPAASDDQRDLHLLEAYDAAVKAALIAQPSAPALKQETAVKPALAKARDRRLADVAKLVSNSKFEEARAELGRATSLDSRIGRERGADIASAAYSLYFQWAKSLESKGSIQEAEDRLDTAIAARRSDEAVAFKMRLEAKNAALSREASFEAALPEIDKCLAKGDLLGASKRLVSAARLAKDRAKLAQLDSRQAKITSALGDLYQKGVEAYRSEDFKAAIERLSVVVGIDADYERASDYLGKAREKQGILDQFSN
jgi:hypothetical protein